MAPLVYADYVKSLIAKAHEDKLPIVTTDPNLLEHQAKSRMTPSGHSFVKGGAGEGATIEANRRAFSRWNLVPRVLRCTTPRDLSVNLFGEVYDSPVIMAPIGVGSLIHPDKEIGVAAACAALRVPYTLSSVASTSFEELAQAVPESPKWFQLYWPSDDDITVSLLNRARLSGFKVLVVTLDTWTVAWRPTDLDSARFTSVAVDGGGVGLTDPVVRRKFAESSGGGAPEDGEIAAGAFYMSKIFPGFSREWEDIALLRRHWDGPIVLKGILSADDAVLAAEHGVDGIVVSNHGGRQLDGCVATLDALPGIVDAVGHRLTVMIDGGFRTGADIVKGLALGANAVLVGRPVIYGLGINGKEGAGAVLAGLLADFDITMGFVGARTIADLKPSMLCRSG